MMNLGLRRLFSVAFAALMLIPLTACVPISLDSESPAITEIAVLLGESGRTLKPYSPVLANRQIGELVFRGLCDVMPDGMPVPDVLAELPTGENGGISSDGRTVLFKLVDDAVWHDGVPLTAQDVAYTLELLRDGVIVDQPTLGYDDIESVEVVDSTHLRVVLGSPNAPLVWSMVPYVLPEHILGQDSRPALSSYWFEPVGSGPYRVAGVVPGHEVMLEPVADAVASTLRVYFTQTAEEARDLFDANQAAVWFDGPTAAGSSSERVVTAAGTTWRAWIFNMDASSIAADDVVRDAYMSMMPSEIANPHPEVDPFGLPLLQRTPESTDAVAAMLDSEGWRMSEENVRIKDGRRLELTTATRTLLSEELPWFEAVTANMGGVGLVFRTFTLDFLDVGGFLDRDYLVGEDWDVARTRYYAGSLFGTAWPFASSDVPGPDNPYGGNVFGIADETLDSRYADLRASSDPGAAREAYVRMGERLNELGVVYWEYPDEVRMLIKGVEDVETPTTALDAIGAAPSWRILGAGDTE